ncbi:MAG: hypothetical protein RL461_1391 [Planctomycetota bacterium]|jgi:uncharacterized protein (DUF58 family)
MKRRLAYRPALGGLVFLIAVPVLLLAVVWRPSNLLVWAVGTVVGMIVVSGLASGAMMMALRVRRLVPRDARVGQPLALRYEVHNASWIWPAFAVSIRESALGPAEAWLVSAAPGERCVAELTWWPTRRGEVRLGGVVAQSSFPFGLVGKRVTWVQRATVTVLPRVVRVPAPRLRALLDRGPAGMRAASRPGHGEEFFGVRDAPELTSLRDVAWRRSASRDQLAVIERSSPSYPRLRLVLNLAEPTASLAGRLPAGVDARQREEDAITMAASLASSAIALGHEVSLRVHGLPCVPMPPAGGVRHLDRLLVQLARLDLDAPRTSSLPSGPGDERAATVVIHPGRIDASVGGVGAVHQSAAQLDALCALAGGAS